MKKKTFHEMSKQARTIVLLGAVARPRAEHVAEGYPLLLEEHLEATQRAKVRVEQ